MAEILRFPTRVIWISPTGARSDITWSPLGAAIRHAADDYRAAGGSDAEAWLDAVLPDGRTGEPGAVPGLFADGGRVIGDWARIEIEEIEDPRDGSFATA